MNSRGIDISLIVVFHNEASSIGRALESIAIQNVPTAEFIFVDDGSDDNSMDIVREFMLSHPDFGSRFKLMSNPECCGCANSAAKGLAVASGEYVMRCDGDDYMEPGALQSMLDATCGGAYDVVMAPYYEVFPDYRRKMEFRARSTSLNDMYMSTLNFALWNKLIRRKLLVENGITQFEGLDCWEDLGVTSRVFALHPKVNFVDTPVYNYVRNPERKTLTRSSRKRILKDHLGVCKLVEEWMVERGQDKEFEEFLNHLKFCAKVKYLRGKGKDIAGWKSTYPEVNKKVMSLRHINLSWRVVFAAVALLPSGLSQWIADCFDLFYISEN